MSLLLLCYDKWFSLMKILNFKHGMSNFLSLMHKREKSKKGINNFQLSFSDIPRLSLVSFHRSKYYKCNQNSLESCLAFFTKLMNIFILCLQLPDRLHGIQELLHKYSIKGMFLGNVPATQQAQDTVIRKYFHETAPILVHSITAKSTSIHLRPPWNLLRTP